MATTETPEFVLFMTPTCKFCKNFIDKIKPKPDLIKKINIVNIDNLEIIPNEIDEVPSIYDGKQIYKGSDAFKWLNDKLLDFLLPANDGMAYSFLENNEEQIFNNYSLLDQKNGCYGIGESASSGSSDPTRMTALTDNTNKNRTLDALMASRNSEFPMTGPDLNKLKII